MVDRVATVVLDEATISCLGAMRDGGCYSLICFDFHRSQDACLAPCTRRRSHGCVCNRLQAGHPSLELQQLQQQRGLQLAEVRQQQYLQIETYWGGADNDVAVGSCGLVKVP